MLGVGTRRLLFWMTVLTLVGSTGLILRRPVCADFDPGMYMTVLGVGPAILVIDALASIFRRKARDSRFVASAPDGIRQIQVYKSFDVSGPAAVSLGRLRLIFPALTLLVFGAFLFFYGQSSIPPC